MKAIGIIPARMGASRFPGKPLAPILGMPLVGHCYHRTKLVPGLSEVYVATCDAEILDYIEGIGGKAVMTSGSHDRASTRSAEALEIIERDLGEKFDVVVMVQGDEPLAVPSTIGKALNALSNEKVEISNVMSKIVTDEAFIDKNNVKVVTTTNNDALYFSREPIPSAWKNLNGLPRYMQTGIIAFRRDALMRFNAAEETKLELHESVDMNRVIETGGSIRMIPVDDFMIGVDTPEELIEAENYLLTDPELQRYMKS
ncbi:3-deoxy-manno-octulosonate cytidylyltransferase [Porticoccaceae bacterium]|nr:3-deoxy-manno-octulosonate cytidylyltransferase [Porticoccaceae bacterium]